MNAPVHKVTVLGAGTMGVQIAALFAKQGISCDLLDLVTVNGRRNRMVEDAIRNFQKWDPNATSSRTNLNLIRPGNFSDDLHRISESDWVIEAVTENLTIKHNLWSRVARHVTPDTLMSSNTSGIPIDVIAEAIPSSLKPTFLGTHFFNPPSKLKLIEIIPGATTSENSVVTIKQLAQEILGRHVVIAHDVPGFIANRIWAYGTLVTLRTTQRDGLAPDEVDSITGKIIGRPSSATFRTLDLVGLDVFTTICDNISDAMVNPVEKAAFKIPSYVRHILDLGWKGQKAGQGFYKKASNGEIQTLDLNTFKYKSRKQITAPNIGMNLSTTSSLLRLKNLLDMNDNTSQFIWDTLAPFMVYAAQKVGEICDDITSIDRTMTIGFGWEAGPFEIWDALGVEKTVERMKACGLHIPDWVELLAKKRKRFYPTEEEHRKQATPMETTRT